MGVDKWGERERKGKGNFVNLKRATKGAICGEIFLFGSEDFGAIKIIGLTKQAFRI